MDKRNMFYLNTQFVTYNKNSVFLQTTCQNKVTVSSEIQTEHINAPCGQNVKKFNNKTGDTCM
jgi:hypothetical protein